MEVDNGEVSSDDEQNGVISVPQKPHSAQIRIDLETPEAAEIVCQSLNVDKEPARSKAVRSLSVDKSVLVVLIESSDRRSLQKSIANMFEMCDLAKSTIDLVEKKSWISTEVPAKKPRLDGDHQ